MNSECQQFFSFFSHAARFDSLAAEQVPPPPPPPTTTRYQIECTRIESLWLCIFIRMRIWRCVCACAVCGECGGVNGLLCVYVIGYCVCSNQWIMRKLEANAKKGNFARFFRFFLCVFTVHCSWHALCCARVNRVNGCERNRSARLFFFLFAWCLGFRSQLHYSGINLRQRKESDWFIRIFIWNFIAWENTTDCVVIRREPSDTILSAFV